MPVAPIGKVMGSKFAASIISKFYFADFFSVRASPNDAGLGLGTEFRSEKFPRNRLGMVSVIPRKKVLIPRHSEFRGRASSEARNETERYGIPRKENMTLTLDIDGLLFIRSWKLLQKSKRSYFKRTWLKFMQYSS
jgi:hypothetical protein